MKHKIIAYLKDFGHTTIDAEGETFEEARQKAIKALEGKGWTVMYAKSANAHQPSDTEVAAQNEDAT